MNEEITTSVTPAEAPAAAPAEPTPQAAPEASQATPAAVGEPADNNAVETAGSYDPKDLVTASQANGSKLTVVEDPVTGRRTVRWDAPEEGADKPKEENQTEGAAPAAPKETGDPVNDYWNNQEALLKGVTQPQGENAPPPYSVDEFAQMVATNQEFDERRVPPELQKHYAEVKVTRAMEEANNRRRAEEAARKDAEAKMMTPEQQKAIRQEFFRELENQAKAAALQDMGLSEEQYESMKYDENADPQVAKDVENAISYHKQELVSRLQNESARQNYEQGQRRAVYQEIVDFTLNAKRTEKNFDLIDKAMTTRYQYLPYEQGKVIENALVALKQGNINAKQAEVVRKYYEATRKEFYAHKNGVKANGQPTAARPTPPVVENAGTGKPAPAEHIYTGRDLRGATRPSDKQAIVAALMSQLRR